MKKIYILFVSFVMYGFAQAQLSIDLESGAATFGYNNVRIPGNSGTFFSLSENFENKLNPFFRARLQYTIAKRHSILALYAPFVWKSNGSINKPVYFQNQLFIAGSEINATWQFNSYRLSYQYHLVAKEKFTLALGITGKIRDAEIALVSSGTAAEKTNVGFVPLIRFYADVTLAEKFHLIADGDALVAKQGRAEDVLLAIGYNPLTRLRLKLGYRLLEGGADNDEVYNFSAVHYWVGGVGLVF